MNKKLSQTCAVILILMCLFITCFDSFCVIAAVPREHVSVVIQYNSSFYFLNGTKVYYDYKDTEYYPQYKNGELFVKVKTLSDMLGCQIRYDGKTETFHFELDGKTAAIRLREDAVYSDGRARLLRITLLTTV